MKQPYKHELRSEIAQLKEDLYTAMDGLDNTDLFYKLASKNVGYYHWYFEKEASRNIEQKFNVIGLNDKSWVEQTTEKYREGFNQRVADIGMSGSQAIQTIEIFPVTKGLYNYKHGMKVK